MRVFECCVTIWRRAVCRDAFAAKPPVGLRSTKIAFVPRGASLLRSVCHSCAALRRADEPSESPAGLGVLDCEISPALVDHVVELAGCREQRRRLLPARAVVYFVLGLCLFSGADSAAPPGYRSVMRWLTGGIRHLHGLALPTSSALTRARQRLGPRPLELLFDLRRGAAGRPGGRWSVRVRAAAGGLGRDRAWTRPTRPPTPAHSG